MAIRPKLIKIQNGASWLSFYCLYSIEHESQSTERATLSRKMVEDFKGYRIAINGELDFVTQSDLTVYNQIAKGGGYPLVEYYGDDGATHQAHMKIAPFQPTVLAYNENGVPYWHNVKIEMIGQEVE